MYRIITTSGTELGLTDSVRYIKKSDAGAFVQATVGEAIGVAYGGVAYNLIGHSEIADADTVIVVDAPLGQLIAESEAAASKLQANIDYIAMMSDIELDEESESEETAETTEEEE